MDTRRQGYPATGVSDLMPPYRRLKSDTPGAPGSEIAYGGRVSKVKCQISISADGCLAGPNQSEEHPLGEGGEALHEWVVKLAAWRRPHGREGGEVNASSAVMEGTLENVGATIMGRNMFGGGSGPWGDDPWDGWWGDEPPFHHPVFVFTHHERERLDKQGGKSFTFVTGEIES